MNELFVESLSTSEQFDSLALAWRELESRAPATLPFQTFAWNRSWWNHLAAKGGWVRDDLLILAVRTREGRLVGVAPMMVTRRPGVGPISVRTLSFFGADPNLTEVRGPLCDSEFEDEAISAIQRHLSTLNLTFAWVTWSGIRKDSKTEGRFLADGAEIGRRVQSYLLPLPSTWEELRSSRSRNLKESLRKCYNSLRRDGLTFSIDVAQSIPDVRAALPRFFELHALRSRHEGTIRHRDVFAAPVHRAFLVDVVERFAAQDQARIFQMRIGDQVVASRIGFVVSDTLYLYYSGYDPSWGAYSVMTTTVAEALKLGIHLGLRWANLSTGNDVSKTRWSPSEIAYSDMVVVSSTSWARFLAAAFGSVAGNERVRLTASRLIGRRAA
jgi:CelD/BcsL family acetyltransferase involved in cellulose biosynthesis